MYGTNKLRSDTEKAEKPKPKPKPKPAYKGAGGHSTVAEVVIDTGSKVRPDLYVV